MYDFIVNRETQEVYANVGSKPIDYLYSSDFGKTWQIDSAFKGHMARMFVVAPHVLWAAIGPSYTGNIPSLVLAQQNGIRSLAYSSDNGTTWSVDSTTLKVDSEILAMHWLDARHGWISMLNLTNDYTHPVAFIWYYDADANASVQTTIVGVKYGMIRVYPNPATNVLYMEDSYSDIQIYDPLGRRYPVTITGNEIDISRLSSGIYFLYDGIAARAKFVKQ